MTDEIVLLEIKDFAAYVTLNRPEVHNAFDDHVIASLGAVLEEVSSRDDVHVVIFRGRGKSFSAGADLNWMKRAAAYTEAQNKEDALKLARMLNKIYTLPMLTVACVQGVAIGGGLGLLSCCDIVIAEKDATFGFSEVKLGLVPATIGPYVIAAIGARQARRYFQTGERFNGAVAHRIGLVHEIADRPEDVEYILHTILNHVKSCGPKAMKTAKRLCMDLAGRPISDSTLVDTAACIAQARSGEEAKEGLNAFLEKRKATWSRG